MKSRVAILLCFVLCILLFCACGERVAPEENAVLQPTQLEETTPSPWEEYLSPWKLDVVQLAKQESAIHYYFMSAKGMVMDLTEENPQKWGDACLVVFPNGQTMLIDAGKEAYGPLLVENLRRMGIEKLDYLLFSHSHNDHCFGALTEGGVLDSFPIGQIYWSGVRNSEWEDRYNIELACQSREIPLQILRRDDILSFGAVTMEVLWPMENAEFMSDLRIKNHNNQSLVVRFDYMEHSSLFSGDMYARGEGDLVTLSFEKLDVDLLKAPHHGQSTSNTEEFINATSPQLVVATGYLSISKTVKNRYKAVEATLLHDLERGYIHVWSDGAQMRYE